MHHALRARRERYLSYAKEAECLAEAARDSVAKATYVKAAESWRLLAELDLDTKNSYWTEWPDLTR
jgi:hypothetical protein